MKNIYITITGTAFKYGTAWVDRGMTVRLVKEPDNEFDKEAIRAEVEGLGKIGYVANSIKTVLGDCMSGGRLYDKIGDTAEARVKYILGHGFIICKVRNRSIINMEGMLDERDEDIPDLSSF